MKAIGPAGGLVSNAEDMAKWMHFILSGGQTPSGRYLLSNPALLRLVTPEIGIPAYSYVNPSTFPVSDTLDAYALGWYTGYYRGEPITAVLSSVPPSFSKGQGGISNAGMHSHERNSAFEGIFKKLPFYCFRLSRRCQLSMTKNKMAQKVTNTKNC